MIGSAIIQPQNISVFMPQRMADTTIEQLFIVRQDIFFKIINAIDNEENDSIPQHFLLIGQRGMGKTTLLKRLDIELRKPLYRQKFIPFSFPEEQYNIDRLSKFWLNSLDALADTLQLEEDSRVFGLDKEIRNLLTIKDEDLLSNRAYELLINTSKSIQRRPVFLIDNLNLIIDRLSHEDQSKLKKIIKEPGSPVFVGASATSFESEYELDNHFYKDFLILYLDKLSLDETFLILRHLARITNQELQRDLNNEKNLPRLKTLHELTGGNVRTVVVLFSLVMHGFSENVFQDLEALIDQMTPLYKARFEELSKQAQIVIDTLALNWDPCNLDILREKTLLENNQLSVQLDRLSKIGWITKIGKRKLTYYEISERFFNIWYLMRRSSRRQRRDLLWLTRFLQAWFTKAELKKRSEDYVKIVLNKVNPHEISYCLALARANKSENISKKLLETSYKRLIEISDGDPSIIEKVAGVDPHELDKNWLKEYQSLKTTHNIKEVQNLLDNKEFQAASEFLLQIIKLNPKDLVAWSILGIIYQIYLEKYTEAEWAYLKAIELSGPNAQRLWINLGELYRVYLNKHEDAEKAYKNAISLDSSDPEGWAGLAELYRLEPNKTVEAEQAYKEAIKLDPTNPQLWTALGELYHIGLVNYSEAERVFKKAIELDHNSAQAWFLIGELYRVSLNRYDDAEKAYKKAILLDPIDDNPWGALGELYRINLERYEEAEQAYKKAIELDQLFAQPWEYLGELYRINLNRYPEAEQAYKKAIELDPNISQVWECLGELYHFDLDQYTDAEQAYKRAIDLDPENHIAWVLLGDLYRINLEKYEEAEQAYSRAIEIDPLDFTSWGGLGDLYRLIFDRYLDAEQAYKKAIELDSGFPQQWFALGDLYRINLKRYEDAEFAYKKAIEINSNFLQSWIALGDLYVVNLKRYEDGEQAYKKAIEIDPEDAFIWIALGDLYQSIFNRYSEAEQAYRKAIDLNPEDAFVWESLGRHYNLLAKYDEAEKAYKKAVSINPKLVSTWLALGNLYILPLTNYYKAEMAFKSAINSDSENPVLWVILGKVYIEHFKRYNDAKAAYKKAIQLQPTAAWIWGMLGNLLMDHLGEYSEAEVAYQRAIKIEEDLAYKVNLIFLLRDQLNKIEEAKEIFENTKKLYITKSERASYQLLEATFAIYDHNWGIASELWNSALELINESLPNETKDDWYRSAAVTVRLGYGEKLLRVFEETGYDRVLRPLYEAIKASSTRSGEYLTNEVAAEVRDIAAQIFQFINEFNKK